MLQLCVNRGTLAARYGRCLHGASVPWLVLQGVALVFDTVAGRNFSLVETAAEFLHRYRTVHPEAAEPDALSGQRHQANGERTSVAHNSVEGLTAVKRTMLTLSFTHGNAVQQAQHLPTEQAATQ